MKVASVIILALAFVLLIRRNTLQVDLSFPWFFAVVILGFAGLSPSLVHATANLFGIVSDAMVIVLLALVALLGIVTTLAVALSRIRRRQILIIRRLAAHDLQRDVD